MIKGYTYDEFGNLAQSGASSFLNEVTFTGSVSDTSSGLQYMNARFYQPSTGRFLSQDTHTGNAYDPWTQHLYSYCGNNPVNMIDPTGHFWYLGNQQFSNDTSNEEAQAIIDYKTAKEAADDWNCTWPAIEKWYNENEQAGNERWNKATSAGANIVDVLDAILDGQYRSYHDAVIGLLTTDNPFSWETVKDAFTVAQTYAFVYMLAKAGGAGKGLEVSAAEVSGTNVVKYGYDFGKMGIYTKNPRIKVDWSQFAEHGYERMAERGITKNMVESIVKNGKALCQSGGAKYAYITKQGCAIVSNEGRLISAYGRDYFDSNMNDIINKLFGK